MKLTETCWDADPEKRVTVNELAVKFEGEVSKWRSMKDKSSGMYVMDGKYHPTTVRVLEDHPSHIHICRLRLHSVTKRTCPYLRPIFRAV